MKKPTIFRAIFLIVGIFVIVANFAYSEGSAEKSEKETFTVGFSNGPFTHSWRVQMVDSLRQEFQYYQNQGIVDKLIIQNAGSDVNTQIAQIRNLIASGVDLLLINPNSATALNPVMEEAQKMGILVIVFDMPIENPDVLNIYMDQKQWMSPVTEWLCEQLDYEGEIVYISGIPDLPGNIKRDNAAKNVISKYDGIELLSIANGFWDQAKAQQVMTDLLSSFTNIDGVLTQDGMSLGIIRAFNAAGKDLPVITGETQVAFIKKWKELKDSEGFETIGITNSPGAICNALGIGIRLLQGKELKDDVLIDGHIVNYGPALIVTNDNIDEVYEEYKDWADSYYVNQWMSQEELDSLFR